MTFVHKTQTTFTGTAGTHRHETRISPIPQVASGRREIYLVYFFTSFLRMNAFTGISPHFETSLSSLIHCSPELCDAINAVAALHITQCSRSGISAASSSDDTISALRAYSHSVRCVQAKITSNAFSHDASALWTTLLLGVFEVRPGIPVISRRHQC